MGEKKIIKVDKISTSFVKSDLKFCTDKGSGESKLFVGSTKNKKMYEKIESADFFLPLLEPDPHPLQQIPVSEVFWSPQSSMEAPGAV